MLSAWWTDPPPSGAHLGLESDSLTSDNPGRLVLVVGPSGAGKDALLGHARRILADDEAVLFAERIVTRPNRTGNVTHVEMDALNFELKSENGEFGLYWAAYGNRYGVPRSAFDVLEQGVSVIVNGSRTVVDEARRLHSPTLVILVTASADILRERLHARGREQFEAVPRRLVRAASLTVKGDDVVELVNEDVLEDNAERSVTLISGVSGC